MSYDPEYCDHDGGGWAEHDARGIYLTKVCDKCRKHKLAKYRPAVLTNPGYHADEPIEPEDY